MRFVCVTVIVSTLAVLVSVGCQNESVEQPAGAQEPPEVAASAAASTEDLVRRGEYIVTAGACHDCHTPWKMGEKGPEPDMARAFSGHPADMVMPEIPLPQAPWGWVGSATNTAFRGPWGVSYAANISSARTGLGDWTEEMFIQTIREGKRFGNGRPIMPPMPWPAFAQFSDEDLKAMFAYLKSTQPIENRPPDWQPPAQ